MYIAITTRHPAYLAPDILLYQKVLALVVEDYMHFLGPRTTNVWSEHDVVGGFTMHVLLVKGRGEDFSIATTTVDVLLMFYGELDDQSLVLIA